MKPRTRWGEKVQDIVSKCYAAIQWDCVPAKDRQQARQCQNDAVIQWDNIHARVSKGWNNVSMQWCSYPIDYVPPNGGRNIVSKWLYSYTKRLLTSWGGEKKILHQNVVMRLSDKITYMLCNSWNQDCWVSDCVIVWRIHAPTVGGKRWHNVNNCWASNRITYTLSENEVRNNVSACCAAIKQIHIQPMRRTKGEKSEEVVVHPSGRQRTHCVVNSTIMWASVNGCASIGRLLATGGKIQREGVLGQQIGKTTYILWMGEERENVIKWLCSNSTR